MWEFLHPLFLFMDSIRKLIRIYTPFVVTLCNLAYGVLFLKETLTDNEAFTLNVISGCSFSFVIYVWAASKHMCIWYKLNLPSMVLMLVDTVLYYVTDVIDRVLYSYIYVLLATAGLICFLAFWFTFVLFRNVVCNRKHSKVQEERQDLVP